MTARVPMYGTVRVRTRIRDDGHSTTWEGWDTMTGERVLLRAWAPRRGQRESRFVRSAPFVCSLADLDPRRFHDAEAGERGPVAIWDPPSTTWSATVLLSVLQALIPIHAAGYQHGWISPRSVVATRDGWTLLWLGPVEQPGDDMRALANLLPAEDLLTDLVAGFADHPPPSIADATRIVLRACSDALASEHHALVARARALGHDYARSRLGALAHRLAAFQPPVARGLLLGGTLEVVSANGVVRAAHGPPGGPFEQAFDVVGPSGLDPVATRAVLRAAWSDANAALHPLVRWLTAASRLRTDRMLLERGR